MKFEISKDVIHNLMLFLDRVDIKGLKEISAMNQILDILQKPLAEENNE